LSEKPLACLWRVAASVDWSRNPVLEYFFFWVFLRGWPLQIHNLVPKR
jgi:hypothetical protein